MPQPLDVLGGLDDSSAYKVRCAVATTSDMTFTMIGLPIIDGYQTQLGDRILVWMNGDQTTNGIYYIPAGPLPVGEPPPVSCGAWVRAIDATNSDSMNNGTQVLVVMGQTYAGQVFVCNQNQPIFGITPITFSLSVLAAQAETSAAAASASAAAASASAAAAAAASAGTGGTASLVITGGTIVLTAPQANAAILNLTGSLTADQFIDFPAGISNPRMVVLQGATTNGFTVYVRGNAGADVIGVWFPTLWTPPVSILVTPTRVYWGGYESCPPGTYEDLPVISPVPPGRLICDGSAISTALYDLLFAQIGYSFGGAGASFSLPDNRGFVLAGADNMGTAAGSAGRLNNWTVKTPGGEANHTLVIGEIPSHTHSANVATGGVFPEGSTGVFAPQTGAGNTGAAGGGGAHNNVQPTWTTLRLIRF